MVMTRGRMCLLVKVTMVMMMVMVMVMVMMMARIMSQAHVHPHIHLTTPELIEARGYRTEVHHVTTDDGYILEMHRIPRGRDKKVQSNPYCDNSYTSSLEEELEDRGSRYYLKSSQKAFNSSESKDTNSTTGGCRVVLLLHGIIGGSSSFLLNDPDQALAFMLADSGYDVWLGNMRGNAYSRRHVHLSPEHHQFWDFSSDEIGRYDIPAMLSYVRQATKVDQVSFVGFSLGTLCFFTAVNYHPHLTSWVRLMVALSPASYPTYTSWSLTLATLFVTQFEGTLNKLGVAEVFASGHTIRWIMSSACDPKSSLNFLCYIGYLSFGRSNRHVDQDYFPVIIANRFLGTSLHVVTHILQKFKSRKFQAFDYGSTRNLKKYGQPSPPVYSLRSVKVPVGIFWSEGDSLIPPWDAQRVASQLPNVVLNHRVKVSDFNHLDFLYNEDAHNLVYKPLINLLDSSYATCTTRMFTA